MLKRMMHPLGSVSRDMKLEKPVYDGDWHHFSEYKKSVWIVSF
jgi:hypothetical protein